jgi:diguanylate cyclase (GGDEF)-like protein
VIGQAAIRPPAPFAAEGKLVVESPISRLEESRGEIAKAWLMRVVERSSLEDLKRLPMPRIAQELPELVVEIARAAGAGDGPPAAPIEWAQRLSELSGHEEPRAQQLVRDLAVLQSTMIAELHRALDRIDPVSALAMVERLAELFSSMQADAVEDVLTVRSGELEWLGTTDSLTGLQNSRFMQQHIQHLLDIQKRYGHPFALLLLDIDGLKRINDAYGAAAGDRTLSAVATALSETTRSVDTPIRMGGDEFCVLLPHQTASRARAMADRLVASIERVDSPTPQALRVSVGVVSCPQHATDGEDLLALADGAMYRAKAAGESVAVPETPSASNGDLAE